MRYSIIKQYFDKYVDVYVDGNAHWGLLKNCSETDTILLVHRPGNEDGWKAKLYGELYIDINHIGAIREILVPDQFSL